MNNPGDPGSWNRFAYAGGDPVNRSDPSGMDWIPTVDGWCSTLDYYGGCYDPGEGGDSEWTATKWPQWRG